MDIINKRRTVRSFKKDDVSNEDIKELIYAAMQAPSARNQQPWSFIVIKNKETIEKLSKTTLSAHPLLGANVVVAFIINKDDLTSPKYVEQDMGACIENFMLKACEKNLGCVWIGGYPNEDRTKPVNEILNVLEGYEAFALVGVGYPLKDDAFRTLPERFIEERIYFEKM